MKHIILIGTLVLASSAAHSTRATQSDWMMKMNQKSRRFKCKPSKNIF